MSLLRIALSAAMTLSFAASVHAAGIEFTPSWTAAFNFNKDEQKTIGIVKQLQIGTTVVAADVQLTNPTVGTPGAAVGALASYAWSGASADPMALSFYLSSANAMKLRTLLQSKPSDTTVKVSLQVADYDPLKNAYFEALAPSQAPLTGKIATVSGALKLTVAPTKSPDLASPAVFLVELTVATPSASATQQSVKLATATDKIVVKA